MTDSSSPARRFYAVVLNYDVAYHRREIVPATSLDEALTQAVQQADGESDWEAYDDPGPTYVERFQVFDSDGEAIAYLNDTADISSEVVPYDDMGPRDQVEELVRDNSILESKNRELQAKVESLQAALATLREAALVVTIKDGLVEGVSTDYSGVLPTVVVIDRDIEGADPADLMELQGIDDHGRAWVSEPTVTVDRDYAQAAIAAADSKRAAAERC